jgi:hypothetical protein
MWLTPRAKQSRASVRGSLCSGGAHGRSANSRRVCPRLSKDTKSVCANPLISFRFSRRLGGPPVARAPTNSGYLGFENFRLH